MARVPERVGAFADNDRVAQDDELVGADDEYAVLRATGRPRSHIGVVFVCGYEPFVCGYEVIVKACCGRPWAGRVSPSRKIKEPPSCPERRPSFVAASRRVHGDCVTADITPTGTARYLRSINMGI